MKKFLFLTTLSLSLISCDNDTKQTAQKEVATKNEEATSKKEAAPKVMSEATLDLTQYGIANNPNNVLGGLKVGDLAPNFEALGNRGRTINLEKETERSPIILTFFRGGWCGYCTKQLSEFKDNLKDFNALDHARVIAVTPQSMEYTRAVGNEERLTYNLIPDVNHEIMKKYKVFYHVTEDYNSKILKFKEKDLNEFNGSTSPVLPVPATYVIGKDMRIKYVFYEPDYSKRPPVEDLLAALQ